MRTYGRVGGVWQQIITNPVTGDNSLIWITTLLQNLLLNQGESPFYAQNGIPAQQAVNSQILPKIAIANIQKQFSPYFASLIFRVSLPCHGDFFVQLQTRLSCRKSCRCAQAHGIDTTNSLLQPERGCLLVYRFTRWCRFV